MSIKEKECNLPLTKSMIEFVQSLIEENSDEAVVKLAEEYAQLRKQADAIRDKINKIVLNGQKLSELKRSLNDTSVQNHEDLIRKLFFYFIA